MSPDSSWAARALTGSAAPSWAASSSAIARSLRCNATLKPERVLVIDHPAGAVGEDPALGRSPAERLDDLLDVEPGLDREDDALGDAEVGAREDDLVDGLDRLPRADRADMGDRPAERVEHRPGVLDVALGAADEDREGRVARPLRTTGHRRIDHAQVALTQSSREVPAAGRGDGRAVDDQGAGLGTLDDAVGSEQHRLDIRGIGHADDHDLGVRCGLRGARGRRDAELLQLRGAVRGPIPGS